MTSKVSSRPLQAGTLCLPGSWQGRHGARTTAVPPWTSAGRGEQCGLKVPLDPREASFLQYQLSSHCPAADGRNDSVARVAVRVDAVVG